MSARRVGFRGALLLLVVLAASGPEARDEQLAGWFDLAVPGGESTLAALGFSLDERAFTLPYLARTLHDREQRSNVVNPELLSQLATVSSKEPDSADSINIPVPLDADIWRAILRPVKAPASNDLFFRILSDRNALLTAAGLISTTDRVRALMMRDRDLLRYLYEQSPAAFALAASRLDVKDDRVVVPGGPDATPSWEALVGAPVSQPSAFIRALLTKDQGRLAWYYEVMGGLAAEKLAAAWPASAQGVSPASALYPAFRDPDPQWRVFEQPFRRSPIDAWMIVTHTDVAEAAAASPLPQATWALLFSEERINREQVLRTLQGPPGVMLPWLVRETLSPLVRERRNRYEMFRLAQRVFADASRDALADVALAVSGIRSSRALVLTLERMQIADASTWAAAVDAARHVSEDADDRRESLASFQAAIALIERMRHARTLDAGTAGRLIRTLSDAVRVDDRVPRAIARWVLESLMPALPALVVPDQWTTRTAYESKILQALAGPNGGGLPIVEWEGLSYISDPVGAEHERLQRMRALLPSPGLDEALANERPRSLADALMALVYATALGDPDGPASLSPDVASRHQFGLGATAVLRSELPWAPPEERQGNGPWHAQGALLGLDLAMSRLFLKRIADQQMPQAPTLTLNDLGTLSRTAVALVPADLRDGDRDELAAAIGRGRERVQRARSTAELVALARECGMSHSARELLPWIASRQREVVTQVFALRDLLWLGKPALSREVLDRWGAAAEGIDGRRVLAMPGPSSWEDYAGRSEVGQVTTQVPDLTLRIVEETARLQLPAHLVPSLLAFALEDYWHDVRARFADDWPRLTRHAAAVPASRIGDYVAALAGAGPLRAQ